MTVVSISRQIGAGGKTLAERVAKRLNYEFADDEVVSRITKAADLTIDVVEQAGRKAGWQFKHFDTGLADTGFFGKILGQSSTSFREEDLFRLLNDIIPAIASRDNIVFLGRGSQFLLPDGPDIIKVLLVGHESHRIDYLMENYGLGLSEVETIVRDWDNSRLKFLRKFTSKDPDDFSNYDLTINTDRVRLEWAEEIVVRLVSGRQRIRPV
jgi:cytidylate kinase